MARTNCTISLPEPIRRYVETRIQHSGFASVSEYVRHLIRDDQERWGDNIEMRHENPPSRRPLASAARVNDQLRWKRG